MVNLHLLTRHIMLNPQNGERIVITDTVTLLHPMYNLFDGCEI